MNETSAALEDKGPEFASMSDNDREVEAATDKRFVEIPHINSHIDCLWGINNGSLEMNG